MRDNCDSKEGKSRISRSNSHILGLNLVYRSGFCGWRNMRRWGMGGGVDPVQLELVSQFLFSFLMENLRFQHKLNSQRAGLVFGNLFCVLLLLSSFSHSSKIMSDKNPSGYQRGGHDHLQLFMFMTVIFTNKVQFLRNVLPASRISHLQLYSSYGSGREFSNILIQIILHSWLQEKLNLHFSS